LGVPKPRKGGKKRGLPEEPGEREGGNQAVPRWGNKKGQRTARVGGNYIAGKDKSARIVRITLGLGKIKKICHRAERREGEVR